MTTLESTRIRPLDTDAQPLVTVDRLLLLVVAGTAVVTAAVMLFLPTMIQAALIAVPPAILLSVFILRNPYFGVYAFFLYSTLRPYDLIPALIPLRITLIIEIFTLVAWAISLVIHRRGIKWSSFHTMFAAFTGVVGLTVITASNNYVALQSFIMMIVTFVMFVIASDVVESTRRLKQLVWMILLIHLYFAIKGIITFLGGGNMGYVGPTSGRVATGFLSDENEFAMAINMMIPFCIFGFNLLSGRAKMFSGLMLIPFVMAVIASYSRGGLVGLIMVFAYVILTSKRRILSFGLALVVALTMVVFAPESYWQKASTTTDVGKGTANERILYWIAGLRMFTANPIIGVGADNGKLQMPHYYKGRVDPNSEWGRTFHGTWPQVLAETGLLGAIPYFLMMYLAFRILLKIRYESYGDPDPTWRYLSSSFIGSLIAYIGCATFLSTAYFPQVWMIYTLVIILAFCHRRHQQARTSRSQLPAVSVEPLDAGASGAR